MRGFQARLGQSACALRPLLRWGSCTLGCRFHPGCTCAMLPQSQGGVVDANLKVYGLGQSMFDLAPVDGS